MPIKSTSINEYLAALPEDRRQAVERLRTILRKNYQPAFKK